MVAATEMSAPSITIIPGKDDVQSEVTLQDGLTIVDIVSESGIGSAEIRYPTQPQPESIVLRMHLGGLEDLQIKSRESTIQASVSSIHPYPVLQSIVTQGEESAIEQSSPYWLDITIVNDISGKLAEIPLESGHFEVIVPESIIGRGQGAVDENAMSAISVSWIDFYR